MIPEKLYNSKYYF